MKLDLQPSIDVPSEPARDLASLPRQTLTLLRDQRHRDIVQAVARLSDAQVETISFDRGTAIRLRTLHGCLGVMIEGHLALRAEGVLRRPHIVEWWGPGKLLGLAPTMASAATRTYTALGCGHMLMLTSHSIRNALASHPVLSQATYQLMYEELALTQQRQMLAAVGSSKARVAALLLSVIDTVTTGEEQVEVDFPFTQTDLASSLGLSLTQTHRAVAQLKSAKVAHVARQRLRVESVAALRAMAIV